MRAITIRELIAATGGVPVGQWDESTPIPRITIDSRRVQPGDLFWALEGQTYDGHGFVDEAFAKGAVAAIVEDGTVENEQTIRVADSLMALWDLADWYRRQFDALVIGVTGSVGKTTTRRMISAVLSTRFRGIESPHNYNNHFGVPLSLLQLEEHHDYGVIEIGASQLGEIADLTEVANPEVGVVTAIGPSHLDEFGSYENIIKTKQELIERLPEEGFAILNGDDRNVRQMKDQASCQVILVGERKHNDLVASNIETSNGQLRFSIGPSEFCVPVNGKHHLTSALIAVAIGRQVDMEDHEIQEGLARFEPVAGRCQELAIGPWTVIDDTYNSNPVSVSAACRTLRDWKTEGKRILLTGDMLSLGEWSEDFHHLLGEEASRSKIDRLIAIGSQAVNVAGSARKNGMDAGCLGTCHDHDVAMMLLDLWLEPGDVILIKGSRGMKMETFIPRLRQLAEQKFETPFEVSQRKAA